MIHGSPPAARIRSACFVLSLCALGLGLWFAGSAGATGFKDQESQVQSFRLANGLTFIVLERHDAPVFSYRTYVNAGGVNETAGITGIAHMFEHMAFKGTRTVGTTDFEKEAPLLERIDAAWESIARETARGEEADSSRLAVLQKEFADARQAAGELVKSNEFSRILEGNGAPDVNAYTSMDQTVYQSSFPSNRLELWARLEGDRLTNPVLREFYTEREVVQEERRFSESSPMGRLFTVWWSSCFLAHPYGNGLIGFPSDLKSLTREDAQRFFDTHYIAPNITIALVGDVQVAEVRRLAEKYFSGVRTGTVPPPVRTQEPKHKAEIRVTVEDEAQPMVVMGYPCPSSLEPEWAAAQLMGDILGSGRSSRLYERLVKKDKLAVQVSVSAGFPGDKYRNLIMVTAVAAKDATPEQLESVIREELQRFQDEGPSPEELAKVKRRARAGFIRALRSNGGLAERLAEHQGKLGDWRKLFRYLDEVDGVTAGNIKALAQDTFRPQECCIGVLRKPAS